MIIFLPLWLLIVSITNGGHCYDGYDPTGGVSDEKKLKVFIISDSDN